MANFFGLCYGTWHATNNPIQVAPAYARPTIEGSAIVIHPESIGDDGNGLEGRVVGKPSVIVARSRITSTGFQWYWDFFAAQQNGEQINIQAYGMRTPGWNIYTCNMKRPRHSNQGFPSEAITVSGFECRFTDLILVAAMP